MLYKSLKDQSSVQPYGTHYVLCNSHKRVYVKPSIEYEILTFLKNINDYDERVMI